MGKRAKPGERELLETIRLMTTRRLAGGLTQRTDVRIGIGDDCAVVRVRPDEELVVTTDLSIEGRHFRREWHPAEAVGHKCLARGLSDIAAMGGRPVAAFVSLALPGEMAYAGGARERASLERGRGPGRAWMLRFYDGLLALAAREKVMLAGGDLSESPTLAFADVVVVGAVGRGRALLRSTARVGDLIYVTGTLGGAAAELKRLEEWHAGHKPGTRKGQFLGGIAGRGEGQAGHPHFYPQPRLAVGRALARRRLAASCIDLSDGLSTDLLHLCEASGLSAEIRAEAVPVDASATLEQALHGGDDYELLFTAPEEAKVPRQLGGVSIHKIGKMVAKRRGKPMTLVSESSGRVKSAALLPRGWEHFDGGTKDGG